LRRKNENEKEREREREELERRDFGMVTIGEE
jgi:hypothetical protein